MGYCIIEGYAPVGGWTTVPDRSPSLALPRLRVPKYHDPADPRSTEDVRRDLTKVFVKVTKGDTPDRLDRITRAIGRSLCPGYRVVATDGCAATGERGDGTDPSLLRPSVTVGRLTADVWRAYGRVRTCRPARSGAVRWTWVVEHGVTTLTLSTTDPEGFEAHETVDIWQLDPHTDDEATARVSSEVSYVLADQYVWPCRGRDYTVQWEDGPAVVFTDRDSDLAVGIMGLRL